MLAMNSTMHFMLQCAIPWPLNETGRNSRQCGITKRLTRNMGAPAKFNVIMVMEVKWQSIYQVCFTVAKEMF